MAFNANLCLQQISELEEVIRRLEEHLFWNRIEQHQREDDLLDIRWRQMIGVENNDPEDESEDTQASDYDSDDTYDNDDAYESDVEWLCNCEDCPKKTKLDE